MTRKSESLGWIIVPKDLLDYLSGPGLTVTTPDEQNCHIIYDSYLIFRVHRAVSTFITECQFADIWQGDC